MNTVAQTYKSAHRVWVDVPDDEMTRFCIIAEALGCTVEKKTGMQRAMDDIREGRVYSVNSLDELKALV